VLHGDVERGSRLVEDDELGCSAMARAMRHAFWRRADRETIKQIDGSPTRPRAPRSARSASRPLMCKLHDRVDDGARRVKRGLRLSSGPEHHLDALAQRQRAKACGMMAPTRRRRT